MNTRVAAVIVRNAEFESYPQSSIFTVWSLLLAVMVMLLCV